MRRAASEDELPRKPLVFALHVVSAAQQCASPGMRDEDEGGWQMDKRASLETSKVGAYSNDLMLHPDMCDDLRGPRRVT